MPAIITYTFFKRKGQTKSPIINLSYSLFSDVANIAAPRTGDSFFSNLVSVYRFLSSGLLRLFGFHLIISPKEFLPDAKSFDMQVLSAVIICERVDRSDKIFLKDT